jgi:hypothetical protein
MEESGADIVAQALGRLEGTVLGSADAGPRRPLDFYAQDRWHAMTHVLNNITAFDVEPDFAHRLCTALEALDHRGPVHVTILFSADGEEFDVELFTFVAV